MQVADDVCLLVPAGAFSAYRYHAIQNDPSGEGPLKEYFKGETLHHSVDADLWTKNMYLAEDRVLCWELVSKRRSNYVLHYVRSSYAETDVPDGVAELISQRRRWLNGACRSSSPPHIIRTLISARRLLLRRDTRHRALWLHPPLQARHLAQVLASHRARLPGLHHDVSRAFLDQHPATVVLRPTWPPSQLCLARARQLVHHLPHPHQLDRRPIVWHRGHPLLQHCARLLLPRPPHHMLFARDGQPSCRHALHVHLDDDLVRHHHSL